MSIWQSSTWWKMLEDSKQVEKIYNLEWVQIEKRSLWMGVFGFFILWLENHKIIEEKKNRKNLEKLAKQENVLFVQVELLNYHSSFPNQIQWWQKWFDKKFIMPHTALIDLTLWEDDILSCMKPKGRYNIKLAKKKWVEVINVEKNDSNIKIFCDLMKETTSRDGFSGNSFEYYKIFLDSLESSQLLLAYIDGVAIAGWIFMFEQEVSLYYYGASTSQKQYRNLMAPYLLQWTAICQAKQLWSQMYDFLWVASPWEKDSWLSWVTDFKCKLTRDVRCVSQSYIWINRRFVYTIFTFFRKIKRLFSV